MILPQCLYISGQRILPGGQSLKSVPGQLLLVHPAVGRSLGLGSVLLCRHRHHIHLNARLPENRAGKFIPGTDSLVGGMVDTILIREHHIYQKLCQIVSIGGRSYLVIDYADCIMVFRQIEHSLYEILTVYAKGPGQSDDEILLQKLLHRQLSLVLRHAVHTLGIAGVLRFPERGAC